MMIVKSTAQNPGGYLRLDDGCKYDDGSQKKIWKFLMAFAIKRQTPSNYVQNTFCQVGNDSKWFLKTFFKIR